jgi:hypothetical protein
MRWNTNIVDTFVCTCLLRDRKCRLFGALHPQLFFLFLWFFWIEYIRGICIHNWGTFRI